MDFKTLGFMVKKANAQSGFKLLPEPSMNLVEAPKVEVPKLPKTPKLQAPKLSTTRGKAKPLFTHEFKTNSPYNEE